MDDGVRGFGEEERRRAFVLAHFADVLDVVAADAPDAAHREHLARARDLDIGLRRLRNDVLLVVAHDHLFAERAGGASGNAFCRRRTEAGIEARTPARLARISGG